MHSRLIFGDALYEAVKPLSDHNICCCWLQYFVSVLQCVVAVLQFVYPAPKAASPFWTYIGAYATQHRNILWNALIKNHTHCRVWTQWIINTSTNSNHMVKSPMECWIRYTTVWLSCPCLDQVRNITYEDMSWMCLDHIRPLAQSQILMNVGQDMLSGIWESFNIYCLNH